MTALRATASTSALVAGLLVGSAALALLAMNQATRIRASWPEEADALYLPSASTLRRLALGHTELAADLVAARANVYFGAQVHSKRPHLWLRNYFGTAIDLDPRLHRLYQTAATMMVYGNQTLSVESFQAANVFLERGIRLFPEDWNLRFQLGFNLFFELPGIAGEGDPRVPGWRQQGLEALREVTTFDGAPAWLPNLVARLLTKSGSDELAIKQLEQAYAATSSKETRDQIRAKLMNLQAAHLSERIEAERRDFETMLETTYPYAPEAFNVVIGSRLHQAVTLVPPAGP
jgi:DNA-binding transcriptional regulator YbjK